MDKRLISLLIVFCIPLAVQSSDSVSLKQMYIACAASNAIVAIKMEPGVFQEIVSSEAQRHASLARAHGASTEDIQITIKQIGETYNSGALSWDQLVELAEECSNIQ